jgi:transcriptional regulator
MTPFAPKENEKYDFLRGSLDLLILKVVNHGPIHGYAVSQRIQQISRDFFQVPQGSLYPALHRLEDRGWIEAEWKISETGREAKFYALTRKGQKQLEAEIAHWDRFSGAVALILRTME